MDTRDILILLLMLVLLVWVVYVLAFVARTLLKKRGAADHDLDKSFR